MANIDAPWEGRTTRTSGGVSPGRPLRFGACGTPAAPPPTWMSLSPESFPGLDWKSRAPLTARPCCVLIASVGTECFQLARHSGLELRSTFTRESVAEARTVWN